MADEVDKIPEVELVRVEDKFAAGWPMEKLFSDWDIRVTLIFTNSVIESINRAISLRELFEKRLGEEGIDWEIDVNCMPLMDDVIYLKDTGNILAWMLADDKELKKYIAKIQIFEGVK